MPSKSNCGQYHSPGNPCQNLKRLEALVNSFPALDSSAITDAYQKVLAHCLLHEIPSASISPEPSSGNPRYTYNGHSQTYRVAFAPSSQSPAVGFAVQLFGSVLTDHSVPCLTEEIRAHVAVAVDAFRLSTALSQFWSTMDKYCAYLYISTFKLEYSRTANSIAAIPEKERPDVAQELHRCIKNGHFTANVNYSISEGGESARLASWFLFNLWVSLYVLGYPDVDDAIEQYAGSSVGLKVPSQLRAHKWISGGYKSWFNHGLGPHMYKKVITADFPEMVMAIVPPLNLPQFSFKHYPCGYSHSFCEWGSLAWFKMETSGCCFHESTAVLMSDGSVKQIKYISKGDMVYSTRGPRKVIMVESPLLAKRDLWNINGLDLSFTSGHCFRTARGHSPKRVAVEEMVTMDSAPTMTMDGGVGKCKEGSEIQSVMVHDGNIQDSSVIVTELKLVSPPTQVLGKEQQVQRVYDIILENWWADDPAYFVGGPHTFLAVDAETSNPMADQPTSAAILSMMSTASSAVKKLGSPSEVLPAASASFDMLDIERRASVMAFQAMAFKSFTKLRVPKISVFENEDGSWSEHASYMEYFLISRFARWLRSVIRVNTGYRSTSPRPNDVLVVGIHDIELSGDHGMSTGCTVEIEIRISNGEQEECQTVSFTNDTSSNLYLIPVHKSCVYRSAESFSHCALHGMLKCAGLNKARFNCSVVLEKEYKGLIETFLFAPDHKIMGRLSLSTRRQQADFKGWETPDKSMMLSKGVALGRLLGHKLASTLEGKAGVSGFEEWLCN